MEDAIEDRDGGGAGQVGKRIFLNMDDDNKNGEPDVYDSKADYSKHDLHDKDFAEVKLDAAPIASLAGYSLWLGVDVGLKAWAEDDKTPLSDLTAPAEPPDGGINLPWEPGYDPDYDTWYYWNIDSQGASFPSTVFVEGWLLHEAEVFWRLVEPGGSGPEETSIVARDTVEINTESIVWRNQDPSAVWNPHETTLDWNGFVLGPGWYIEKSLGQIINGATGYIRTEYPQNTEPDPTKPERWEGTPAQRDSARLDLAELCGTPTWEPNETVRIELTYEFEQSPNITVGDFVDTNMEDRWQASFFHNSGVKIENRAEIQIFDTEQLLDAIGGSQETLDGAVVDVIGDPIAINTGVPGVPQYETKVKLDHGGPPWTTTRADQINSLISGIPYALDPLDYLAGETNMQRLDRAPKGGQTMIIDVSRDNNGNYDFTVTIDGHTRTYADTPGSGTTNPGMLYLQSHWGSGVKFTSAKVKKL